MAKDVVFIIKIPNLIFSSNAGLFIILIFSLVFFRKMFLSKYTQVSDNYFIILTFLLVFIITSMLYKQPSGLKNCIPKSGKDSDLACGAMNLSVFLEKEGKKRILHQILDTLVLQDTVEVMEPSFEGWEPQRNRQELKIILIF